MPSRPTIHHGTSTSPRHSTNAVDQVVSALHRKLTANHIEPLVSSIASPRRSSFSMDSILHPQKHKKNDEAKDREARKDKRAALPLRPSSKSKDRVASPSPRLVAQKPATFDTIIESPPLIFIGTVNHSSGALLSGRLRLTVEDPTGEVTFNTFTMVLRATSTTKKPIGKDCRECSERHDELKKWTFLSEPKTYYKNRDNQVPYSFLLPGHLPATTHSQLGSVTYALLATAVTSHGETVTFTHPLKVQRAIPPGPEKSSIRIFPPTNLTGRAQIPPVVHPIGTFPVTMTLSGVIDQRANAQTRWRLRKLLWRVEEHSKVVSTPCSKHSSRVFDGKAVQYTETKILGNDDMKTGWKTDFDTAGGEIHMEFDASVATKASHKATCDVDSASGIEVKHNLVLELIVAEEFVPLKHSQLITPTGAARVLRMQFALLVTERTGMGIAWDEEMPPVYEDVPPSPPGYGSSDKNDGAFGGAIMEDYEGPELEPEELERVETHDPNAPPVYRERDPVDLARTRAASDLNTGLPLRSVVSPRLQATRPMSQEGESSGTRRRLGGWTEDDLGAEAPQYSLRQRQPSNDENQTVEEDFGEGISSTAPVESETTRRR